MVIKGIKNELHKVSKNKTIYQADRKGHCGCCGTNINNSTVDEFGWGLCEKCGNVED